MVTEKPLSLVPKKDRRTFDELIATLAASVVLVPYWPAIFRAVGKENCLTVRRERKGGFSVACRDYQSQGGSGPCLSIEDCRRGHKEIPWCLTSKVRF